MTGIDTILGDPPTELEFLPDEDDRCVNYETCGNKTPGANNTMCTECLDNARHGDSVYSTGDGAWY